MKLLKYGLAVALIAVIALSVAGYSRGPKEPLAATVNGKNITIAEVDTRLQQLIGQQSDAFNGPQGEQMKAQYKQRILDQLIEMELVLQEADKRGIKVTDKEVEEQVSQMMKAYNIKDKKDLEKALKQQKMSMDQFYEEVGKRLRVEKLGNEITKDVKVSSKEVEKYFNENKDKFASKDQVRAAHILVQKEEDAQRILKELKGGADFAELAKKNSTDSGSKDNGGEMPWTDKDQFVPEFSAACWALNPGEISDPVKTDFGFHIIKLFEKKAGAPKAFNEVKDQIKKQLIDTKKQEAFTKWLTGAKKKAKIESFLAKNTPKPAPGDAPSGQAPTQPSTQTGK